jgi:tRNA A37 threonylcarbamoyladenosine dehydratase
MTDPRFSRIERMIGIDGLQRLQASFVVVVGLGAVGSYAVEGLSRAGVGHLRLVDFDEIRPSNINRQLYALNSTIGHAKTDAAAARVRDIYPDCLIETVKCFFDDTTAESVLAGPPQLVIDAIDSVSPKTHLLSEALTRGIPVISSMGAALRTDPAMVRTGPLSEVKNCPLARVIRKRLRKRGLAVDFPCVYSTESVHALPEDAVTDTADVSEETLRRGRKRQTLGSLPTLTGIFGLTAANLAIRMLIARR